MKVIMVSKFNLNILYLTFKIFFGGRCSSLSNLDIFPDYTVHVTSSTERPVMERSSYRMNLGLGALNYLGKLNMTPESRDPEKISS